MGHLEIGKILKKEAMGLGDVKLVAGFGAMIGWELTILAIVAAAFIGVIFSVPT